MTTHSTLRAVVPLAAVLLLAGCATGPNPRDPYEKFNRKVFTFNDAIDRVALKPAATAYQRVLPTFVQAGVSNFFGNLSDLWSGANNLMQGKGADGMSDITRFTMNSTFGIVGLFDIASEAGLHKHNEDFGQTLGAWGVPSGPYLMLPLLGPSTARDAIVIPIDIQADPWAYKNPARWRNVGIALRAVDQRASVLDASNLMEEAALDRYEFIRDGFLQRRQSRITDNGDQKVKQLNIKIPFRKDGQPDAKQGEPTDAKGIRAAYPDDPGATAVGAAKGAPAKGAAAKGAEAKGAEAKPAKAADAPAEAKPAADAPSDAKAIRAAYEDDPGPTPEAPAEQKPRKAPAVSSKPASK